MAWTLAACGGGGGTDGGGTGAALTATGGSSGSNASGGSSNGTGSGSGSTAGTDGGSLVGITPAAPTAVIASVAPVVTGRSVTLDGGGSSDPNGDAITFAWSLTARPAGSAASLANATSARPVLVPDLPGDYRLSLIVSDGRLASTPATVVLTVTAANRPPIAAVAPALRNVITGSNVRLDGSGSSDPDGDSMTYSWTLTRRPAGSTAALSSASSQSPQFVPDAEGLYVATLVVSDGQASSPPASILVQSFTGGTTPADTLVKAQYRTAPGPLADAGPTQTAAIGSTVTLDASASSDARGSPLTWSWGLVSQPAGSNAQLVGAGSARTTLVPDVPGRYRIRVNVGNGQWSTLAETWVNAWDPARSTLATPSDMPAWVAADWATVANVAAAGTATLQLYRTDATGNTAAVAGSTVRVDFGPGTAGHKVATVGAGTGRTVDLFTTPPSWIGNETAGRICWQVRGFGSALSNLCHLPGTFDWTWDAYFGDQAGAYYWSSRAPDAGSWSVLEAMRQGMAISHLFQSTTPALSMGADGSTVWVASLTDPVNSFYALTSPRSRPVQSIACSTWSFTPELYVTDGSQSTCDINDSFLFLWTVTSTTPMPTTAALGARGAMGAGVVNMLSLGASASGQTLTSARIDWSWELRPDATSATALLCAIRSVQGSGYFPGSVLNTTRCFRVDQAGRVTGLQVPEFSPYVQPL